MGRLDPVAERKESRSVILSDYNPQARREQANSRSSSQKKKPPMLDESDEDILDAEDDDHDPFAAPLSDPAGRLMSEPSVITLPQSVASVSKSSSIASGSYIAAQAKHHDRSIGSARGRREHDEEESKQELTLSPFDYSVDTTVPARNSIRAFSRPSDKIHFGSDWDMPEEDAESSSRSQKSDAEVEVEAATNAADKSTAQLQETKRSAGLSSLFSSTTSLVIGALVLLVVILAVVLIVVLVNNNNDSASTDPTPAVPPQASSVPEGPAPTPAPSPVVTTSNRPQDITNFINSKSYMGVDLSPTGTSPEELAMQWLIDDDPLQLNVGAQADELRLLQRYSLLTLWFQGGTGTTWTNSTNWLTADECTWFGMICQLGVVTKVELRQNGLQGSLSRDLGLMTDLTELYLSYNSLSGSLPSEIGLWTNSDWFDVANNALTGSLPSEIGLWTNLEWFDVSDNALTGTIPVTIANWKLIEYAGFYNNIFSGSMPNGICEFITGTDNLLADCDVVTCSCCTQCV